MLVTEATSLLVTFSSGILLIFGGQLRAKKNNDKRETDLPIGTLTVLSVPRGCEWSADIQ